MSEKRTDRRVRKTRDALADALFALIRREDWNAITIQSICDEADVARASFYAHFQSKISLLDFMLERNLGAIIDQVGSLGGGQSVLDWFVDHVTSDRSRFTRIVLVPEAHPVLARFKAVVRAQYLLALRKEGVEVSEAQASFIMGGATELIMEWSRTWRTQQVTALREEVRLFSERLLDRRAADQRTA